MPVPVPMHAITCNRGAGAKLGCPRAHRGIAVATRNGGNKACLKFADLQTIGRWLPPLQECRDRAAGIRGRRLDRHHLDQRRDGLLVRGLARGLHRPGSEINISSAVRAELLASGLLHRKPMRDDGEEPATVELAPQNLSVSEPTPSQNGDEDVLYLMPRMKMYLLKAWALVIDMRNSTPLGVVEFGTGSDLPASITFRPSTIFKHMKSAPAPPGCDCYVVATNA
jgi:hypothetical protein